MIKRMMGTFWEYALEVGADFPEDEEAIDQAFDHMTSLCGNAGQEAMLLEVSQDFYDWALAALEEDVVDGTTFDSFTGLLMEWYDGRGDKVDGTIDIYAQGWMMIAEQSGYHDAEDEYGEGMGQMFG